MKADILFVAALIASGSVCEGSASVSADAGVHRSRVGPTQNARHQRQEPHGLVPRDARRQAGARDPDRFYPNEIVGGVHGNLPFNNQLRKSSDPLNANGGGG